METLETLRDIANGKRRRFFPVNAEAAALFKKWIGDWQAASTLADVLNLWEMNRQMFEDRLTVRVRLVGKRLQPTVSTPRHGHGVDNELLYLIASVVTAPKCERLRVCPECDGCYIAIRGTQKFCGSLCGRRAASRIKVAGNYDKLRNRRIDACKAAYAKYKSLTPKPRKSVAEYVLCEANRHLRRADMIGGSTLRTNFIKQNTKAIGIPQGERQA